MPHNLLELCSAVINRTVMKRRSRSVEDEIVLLLVMYFRLHKVAILVYIDQIRHMSPFNKRMKDKHFHSIAPSSLT